MSCKHCLPENRHHWVVACHSIATLPDVKPMFCPYCGVSLAAPPQPASLPITASFTIKAGDQIRPGTIISQEAIDSMVASARAAPPLKSPGEPVATLESIENVEGGMVVRMRVPRENLEGVQRLIAFGMGADPPPAPPLAWTREKPVAGYYFAMRPRLFRQIGESVEVPEMQFVRVFYDDDPDEENQRWRVEVMGDDYWGEINDFTAWYGPLDIPQPPAPPGEP